MIAEAGRHVTFIEMLDEFMCNITFDERQVYELRFKDLDVSVNTGRRLVEVTEAGVKTVDRTGAVTEFPADSVVLAVGFRPNRELIDGAEGLSRYPRGRGRRLRESPQDLRRHPRRASGC